MTSLLHACVNFTIDVRNNAFIGFYRLNVRRDIYIGIFQYAWVVLRITKRDYSRDFTRLKKKYYDIVLVTSRDENLRLFNGEKHGYHLIYPLIIIN